MTSTGSSDPTRKRTDCPNYAQLGNEIAIMPYREGRLPFPGGSITIAGERLLGGNTNI